MKNFARFALLVSFALLTGIAHAQGGSYNSSVLSPSGRPIGGAKVTVCTSGGTGIPCTPHASIYSDAALTVPMANPLTTDGHGNFSFFSASGVYIYTVTGSGLNGYTTTIRVGGSGGGGLLPDVVAGADYIATSTGVNAAAWEGPLSTCGDSTHAMKYDAVTHKFGCQVLLGIPSSPTNSVQFNNAGAFGGSANFTFNSSQQQVKIFTSGTSTSNGGFTLEVPASGQGSSAGYFGPNDSEFSAAVRAYNDPINFARNFGTLSAGSIAGIPFVAVVENNSGYNAQAFNTSPNIGVSGGSFNAFSLGAADHTTGSVRGINGIAIQQGSGHIASIIGGLFTVGGNAAGAGLVDHAIGVSISAPAIGPFNTPPTLLDGLYINDFGASNAVVSNALHIDSQTAPGVAIRVDGGDTLLQNTAITGALGLNESTAPSGVSSVDKVWGDSTLHWPKMNNNNAGAVTVAGISGAITAGHCAQFTSATTIIDNGSACGAGGTGTVTNFSVAADPVPLFTTSVANPGTTPALSFAISNFAAHKFYGNGTTGAAAPSALLIGASDMSPNIYAADSGIADVLVAAPTPVVTALVSGLEVFVKPNHNNATTTPTLAVSGLTAKTITKLGTTALAAADLTTTAIADLIYDGTEWQLQNPQTTAASGMTITMNNMGTTAMNADLLPSAASVRSLGSNTLPMTNVFIGSAGASKTASFDTSNLSANRTVMVPNSASIIPQAKAAATATWLSALTSPTGAWSTETLTTTSGASGMTVTDTAGVITIAPTSVTGGGNAILQCTESGGATGDYFAISGGICVNQTPGIPINAQTGASYIVLTGDRGKVITQSNASASAYTLPQAGSAGFASNFYFCLKNIGAGAVTITPTTSTVDGAATLLVLNGQSACIYSDNTNYTSRVTGYASVTSGSISGAIVGLGCDSATVTINGAATGMDAHATPNTYPGDGLFWNAYVSAANTVTVKVCSDVTVTPTASTYNVKLFNP